MADYSNPETKALYERYMSQGLEQGLSAPAASAIAQRTVEGTLGQLRPGGTQASIWGSGQDQSEARNAALARVAQEAPPSGGFFDQFAKETVRPAPVRRAVARRALPQAQPTSNAPNELTRQMDPYNSLRFTALNAGNDEQALSRFRQQIQNQKMDRLSADEDTLRNFRQQRRMEADEDTLRNFRQQRQMEADENTLSRFRQQRQMEADEETLRRFRQQRQMEGLMSAAQRETPRRPMMVINEGVVRPYARRNTPDEMMGLMGRSLQNAIAREDEAERVRRLAQELQAEAEYEKFLADSQAAAGMGLSSGELTSGQQMSRDLYSSMRPGMGRL